MTAFVSCCLSRVACLEGTKAKSKTKLRVCQKCGWKRHWLTTAAAALHCFVSTSSLFHSVTGRRRGCDNKKCVLELVFLSVSMAKATHLSVISKNTYFTQPNKPQSGSRTLLSDSVQTLLRCRETSGQRELGSLIYASDSPLKWKAENQYVSSWISSDISFEVCLKGNVSVTAGESGYWKPEAKESIDLDGKQSIPERENELERVQTSDGSCTWRLYSCLLWVLGLHFALWTHERMHIHTLYIAKYLFKDHSTVPPSPKANTHVSVFEGRPHGHDEKF